MSLRSILTTLTILVTVLAVLVAGALVILTTSLHRTTTDAAASVESVRIAQDATIDLLLHERATDPLLRRDLEGNLRRKLDRARPFVTTEDEAHALAQAERVVDAYIEVDREPRWTEAERPEAAYGALEELVRINVSQARAAQQQAERWDELANVLGVGVGVLLVGLAGFLVVWLKQRAFEPIFGLASAMERFGRGDRSTRAAERGPRELREMCRRFNEMASALAAQRQSQMAFLGGVAHDLRNPLSALQLSVTLLRREESLSSRDRVQQTVERIGRQITHMERMLGDFLDVVRIEAGQLELRMGMHDARELVAEIVDLFEATSREHPLEVRLPAEPISVHCDPLRIEQVITNLISNAIKYAPPGSTVEVVLDTVGDELELSVTDHGVGIAQVDLARLFEPFRRVGPSKDAVPGAGLGLFVVRRIIEGHRGRIAVESTPGGGTRFRVFLPLDRELAGTRAARCEHAPA